MKKLALTLLTLTFILTGCMFVSSNKKEICEKEDIKKEAKSEYREAVKGGKVTRKPARRRRVPRDRPKPDDEKLVVKSYSIDGLDENAHNLAKVINDLFRDEFGSRTRDRSTVSVINNLLIVRTPLEIHKEIKQIIEEIPKAEKSKFIYKVYSTKGFNLGADHFYKLIEHLIPTFKRHSSAYPFNDKLVVRANQDIHKEIQEIIDLLMEIENPK